MRNNDDLETAVGMGCSLAFIVINLGIPIMVFILLAMTLMKKCS